LPLAMLEEVQPPAPKWPGAPGGYLQLSEGYGDEADRARELGWLVRQMLSHHLALLTEPARVARELRQLIGPPQAAQIDSVCTVRARAKKITNAPIGGSARVLFELSRTISVCCERTSARFCGVRLWPVSEGLTLAKI